MSLGKASRREGEHRNSGSEGGSEGADQGFRGGAWRRWPDFRHSHTVLRDKVHLCGSESSNRGAILNLWSKAMAGLKQPGSLGCQVLVRPCWDCLRVSLLEVGKTDWQADLIF